MNQSNCLKTPISLHVFNRPGMTRRVFAQIRSAKPETLFLVADGPRAGHPTDTENCKAVRQLLEQVDWKCEVIRNYSDVNMGSYKRNSSGINWLFDNVEEAIILEDDCIPDPSFFPFCEELLSHFRHDRRVAAISGNNFMPNTPYGKHSYFYSRYPFLWGWAGWRRSWKMLDAKMKYWNEFTTYGLGNVFPERRQRNYWHKVFSSIHEGTMNPAWDYEFMLTCFMHNMLTIVPNVNLVTNIGNGALATHCRDPKGPGSNIPTRAMPFPLIHPPYMVADVHADRLTFINRIEGTTYQKFRSAIARTLPKSIKTFIKSYCLSGPGNEP